MSDYLNEADIDEVLESHLPDLWNTNTHRVVYFQARARESEIVEIYGNPAVASAIGRRSLGTTAIQQLTSWISAIAAAGSLRCAVFAGQELYSSALQLAVEDQWPTDVRRVARHGDCQASSNYGTEFEQACTKRILKLSDSERRKIAVIEVLGTDLFFVHANFRWDENQLFTSNLKSCRTFDEFCEMIVPQLVASKGVEEIIFAENKLADRTSQVGRVAPYIKLFRVVGDPDPETVNSRERLRERLASYGARRGMTTNTVQKGGGWLATARKKFGLSASSVSPASATASNESREILRTYLELTQTNDESVIRRLMTMARECSGTDELFEHIKLGTVLLAQAKLGELSSDQHVAELLKDDAKCNLWWWDTAIAVTRNWVKTKSPTNWIAMLANRGLDVILQVAVDSDESYRVVRPELQIAVGIEVLNSTLPFEFLDDEKRFGDSVRQLRRGLDATLILKKDKSEPGITKSRSECIGSTEFYDTLSVLPSTLPTAVLRALLDGAYELWGSSQRHSEADVSFYLCVENFPAAEQVCRDWATNWPNDSDAWFWDGKVQARQKRYERARESYLRSVALAEKKSSAQMEAARCLWLMDRDSEAEGEVRTLIENDPSAEANVLLGKIYYYGKNYRAALTVFENIEADDLNNFYGLVPYLLSLVRIESWDTAKKALNENLQKLSDSELSSYIEVAAWLLRNKGQSAIAGDTFAELLKFDTAWALAVDEVAACYFASDNFSLARDLLTRAMDSSCANYDHYMQLARIYMYAQAKQHQDLNQSFQIALTGIEKFPTSFMLWNQAGESAAFAEQCSDKFFEQAIQLLCANTAEERTAHQRVQLAIAYCNLKRFAEADSEIDRAIAMPDGSVDAYNELYKALIVCAANPESAADRYLALQKILGSVDLVTRSEELRCHIIDLELYGKRGLISNWQHFQALAAQLS